MDENLAEFLNDIKVSNVSAKLDEYDEVFHDEDGLPTDRFLQALKSQAPLSELDVLVDEGPKFDENGVRVGLSAAVGHGIRRGMGGDDADIAAVEIDAGPAVSHRDLHDILGLRASKESDASLPVAPPPPPASQRTTKSSMTKGERHRTAASSSSSSSRNKAAHTSQSSAARTRRSGNGTPSLSRTGGNKKKKVTTTLPPPPTRPTRKTAAAAAARLARQQLEEEEEVATGAGSGANAADLVEAETKVRTLVLRLKGLRETVRVLEAQLSESLGAVSSKEDALNAAHARIKALESRERNRRLERDMKTARTVAAAGAESMEEALDKLKVHKEHLEAKLDEARSREKRAQERCRVLKDYGEKAKSRVGDLETRCAQLNRTLEDGERQRARYRKELRDLSAETAAATNTLDHRDMEMSEMRQRCEHLSNANRELHADVDRVREDNRRYRMDLQASQDRVRALETQVGMLRDRESAGRAQRALSTAPTNSSSARYVRGREGSGKFRRDIDRELESEVSDAGVSYRRVVEEEEAAFRGGRGESASDPGEASGDGEGGADGQAGQRAAGVTGGTLRWTRRDKQAARDSARSAARGSGSRGSSTERGEHGGSTGRPSVRGGGEWSSTKWLRGAPKYDSDGAPRGAGGGSDTEIGRRWSSRPAGGAGSAGGSSATVTSRSLDIDRDRVHDAREFEHQASPSTPSSVSDRRSLQRLQTMYDRVTSASGGSRSRTSKGSAYGSWVESSDSDD